MEFNSRYRTEHGTAKGGVIARDLTLGAVALALRFGSWPIRTVPTATRGVITLGGARRRRA